MTPLKSLIQEKARSITRSIERDLKDDVKFEALNIQDAIEEAFTEIAVAALEQSKEIADDYTSSLRFLEAIDSKIKELKE